MNITHRGQFYDGSSPLVTYDAFRGKYHVNGYDIPWVKERRIGFLHVNHLNDYNDIIRRKKITVKGKKNRIYGQNDVFSVSKCFKILDEPVPEKTEKVIDVFRDVHTVSFMNVFTDSFHENFLILWN